MKARATSGERPSVSREGEGEQNIPGGGWVFRVRERSNIDTKWGADR